MVHVVMYWWKFHRRVHSWSAKSFALRYGILLEQLTVSSTADSDHVWYTHSIRLPIGIWPVIVELCQGHGGRGRRRIRIFQYSRSGWSWCLNLWNSWFSIMAIDWIVLALTLNPMHLRLYTGWFGRLGQSGWGPFGWRGIDHELEAFFGCGKLRYIVFWMRPPYVFLH